METKEIKELMLSGKIEFIYKIAELTSEDLKGNCLHVIAQPLDNKWYLGLKTNYADNTDLTDEQYNMICKYVESEFNEYHSNNSAFTDDDKEHFNSLI